MFRVKYLLFMSNFNQTWIFSTKFSKSKISKSHENPSSGSRNVPSGRAGGRTDRQTDRLACLRAILKIESCLVATCHQDAPNVAPHFFFRTGWAGVQTEFPSLSTLRFSCFLDPSRQRWNRTFYHTDCTFLSVYHCLIAQPQNAETFVADERVPLNKPEIKQSGETHTAVEFLADEINVVKKSSVTWCRKVVSGFIKPMNEYYVCSYRRVSKRTGQPRNITAIYAQTGVRWAAYSRANKSQNMIHLKTWTVRHERSYPTVRTDETAHLIRQKMGEIKVLTLHNLRSGDRNFLTWGHILYRYHSKQNINLKTCQLADTGVLTTTR